MEQLKSKIKRIILNPVFLVFLVIIAIFWGITSASTSGTSSSTSGTSSTTTTTTTTTSPTTTTTATTSPTTTTATTTTTTSPTTTTTSNSGTSGTPEETTNNTEEETAGVVEETTIVEEVVVTQGTEPTTTPTTTVTTASSTFVLAPTELFAYISPSTSSPAIYLKWKDNSNNEEKFKIDRRSSSGGSTSFSRIAEVSSNTINFKDNKNITLGSRYDYRIQACIADLCSHYTYLVEVFIPTTVPTTQTATASTPITNVLPTAAATPTTAIIPTTVPTIAPTVPSIPSPTAVVPTPTTPSPAFVAPVVSPAIIAPNTSPSPTISQTSTTGTNNNDDNNKDNDNEERDEIELNIRTSSEEILEIMNTLSETTNSESDTSGKEKSELIYKDTNQDGVSDYDSIHIYKIDPEKPSPTSVYQGKNISASEKILLGFDPTQTELVKIETEQPEQSTAPVVEAYKVKAITLSDKKEVVIRGQALPNSFITLYIYSTPIMVTVKTNDKGEWQYVLDKELEDGNHTVYAATVNNTGNIVAKSSGFVFVKTAEAATLRDVPFTESIDSNKPELLDKNNLFATIMISIASIALILILVGLGYKRNKENLDI